MQPSAKFCTSLLRAAAFSAALLALPAAHAVDYYWDGDGSGTVGGGTGTWDTSLARWSTDPSGSTYIAWPNDVSPNADSANFGNTSGTVTISSGTTINANQLLFSVANYTIAGADGTSSISLQGPTPTIGGSVASGNVNISAKLTGSSGVTVNFANTPNLFLTGANSFTGDFTIAKGVVWVDSSQLANSGVNSALGAGSSINFTGGGSSRLYFQGATAGSSNRTLNASVTQTIVQIRQTGNLTLSGLMEGTGGFNFSSISTGQLTLSGTANTYSDQTRISGGVVRVAKLADGGVASSIGASTSAAANLYFAGGTLQYFGGGDTTDRLFTLTAATQTIDSSGAGVLEFTNAGNIAYTNGPRNLTLAGSNIGNNILNPAIGNPGGGFTASITKDGVGKWVLTGNNSYTGATLVNAGTLVVSGGGLTGTSGITVSGGSLRIGASNVLNDVATMTLSGGTLDAQSFTDSVGALTLSGNSVISLAGGTLAFLDSSTATWGSFTIDITGFMSGSSLRFGTNASGLLADQLLKFTASGYNTFGLNSSGYLTAVPEPATWGLLAFSLTTVLIMRRRRQ